MEMSMQTLRCRSGRRPVMASEKLIVQAALPLLMTAALLLSFASADRSAHAAELGAGSNGEALASKQPLARSRVYVDAQADTPRAPDITSVVVASDDAGRLSFTVSFANRIRLEPSDALVVGLDVDHDEQTGGPLGMEYALAATSASAELGVWNSSSWSGSGYVPLPGAATSSVTDGSLSVSTTVGRLGVLMGAWRPRLRFVLIAMAGTDQPEESWADDVAGPWSYRVKLRTKLLASKIVLTPHPRAGGILSARVDVTMLRGDYRETLNGDTVKARAVIGGRPLRVLRRGSTWSGHEVTWRLPEWAHGQTVRGSVTVSFDETRVTRTFSTTVG
jgi:hypothetical protein